MPWVCRPASQKREDPRTSPDTDRRRRGPPRAHRAACAGDLARPLTPGQPKPHRVRRQAVGRAIEGVMLDIYDESRSETQHATFPSDRR